MGDTPDKLRRSSKIVRAGEGGMIESRRETGLGGLTNADEVAELVRERQGSWKDDDGVDGAAAAGAVASVPVSSDRRPGLQRLDMVEICEPIRERPLPVTLLERLFLGE